MFCFDDGLSPRNLAREDQPHFLSFGCFLIMYEWNGWDIFCPLGFWPIMIYSRLEGGCECVQRRCHESRIPGRQNKDDIPSYMSSCVIVICFQVIFSRLDKRVPEECLKYDKASPPWSVHIPQAIYLSIFFHWKFLCLGGQSCWRCWSQSWWASSSSSVWENESWPWAWTVKSVKWAKWARRSSEKPKIWNKIIPW